MQFPDPALWQAQQDKVGHNIDNRGPNEEVLSFDTFRIFYGWKSPESLNWTTSKDCDPASYRDPNNDRGAYDIREYPEAFARENASIKKEERNLNSAKAYSRKAFNCNQCLRSQLDDWRHYEGRPRYLQTLLRSRKCRVSEGKSFYMSA